jgi:hypothetical protein
LANGEQERGAGRDVREGEREATGGQTSDASGHGARINKSKQLAGPGTPVGQRRDVMCQRFL